MHHGKDFWDYFQIAIGVITLIVLIYYAIKTADIHGEAQKQNNNNLCPFLVGLFDEGVFRIYNLGRGPAVNILFKCTSPDRDYLPRTKDVMSVNSSFYIYSSPGSVFEIKYSNMFGKRYFSKVEIDKDVARKSILLEFRELSKKESKSVEY